MAYIWVSGVPQFLSLVPSNRYSSLRYWFSFFTASNTMCILTSRWFSSVPNISLLAAWGRQFPSPIVVTGTHSPRWSVLVSIISSVLATWSMQSLLMPCCHELSDWGLQMMCSCWSLSTSNPNWRNLSVAALQAFQFLLVCPNVCWQTLHHSASSQSTSWLFSNPALIWACWTITLQTTGTKTSYFSKLHHQRNACWMDLMKLMCIACSNCCQFHTSVNIFNQEEFLEVSALLLFVSIVWSYSFFNLLFVHCAEIKKFFGISDCCFSGLHCIWHSLFYLTNNSISLWLPMSSTKESSHNWNIRFRDELKRAKAFVLATAVITMLQDSFDADTLLDFCQWDFFKSFHCKFVMYSVTWDHEMFLCDQISWLISVVIDNWMQNNLVMVLM